MGSLNIKKEFSEEPFRETPVTKLTYFIIKNTLGTIVRLLWVRKVTGLENLPKDEPVILAANHCSYFDFLCITSVLPKNIHYLAADKLFDHPFLKYLMKGTNQIKVDRNSKDKSGVHKAVSKVLSSKKILGIFPEGTRSRSGEINKPYTGVAKYSHKHKVKVLPVGVKNTYEVMAPHHKIPRFKKIVEIHIGECISHNNNLVCTEEDYVLMTHDIMNKVAFLAGKKYEHHRK